MHFAELEAVPGLVHGFLLRVPGIDVACDKAEVLRRLGLAHRSALVRSGIPDGKLVLCEQVHGAEVAVVGSADLKRPPMAGVDALVTADTGVALGIYVADCCPLFFVEPKRRVIALAHSGRKGTELGIAGACIQIMQHRFDCEPRDMIAVLGPCIRPPLYEVDFAASIRQECVKAGMEQVYDCGYCTGSDLDRFYSYRMERGMTGRMLAFLMLLKDVS